MPRGYFFGEFEVTDPVAYEVYRAKVPDIISAHGAVATALLRFRGERLQSLAATEVAP